MKKDRKIPEKTVSGIPHLERASEIMDANRERLMKTRQVKQIIDWYEPAFDKGRNWFKRFRAFLRAENELGKTFGIILDVLGFFDPRITTARDYVREKIVDKL